MIEFFERRTEFKETPMHREVAMKLFLKRWEKLEPKQYEVWKSTFVDTGQDASSTSLVAEAYYIVLQQQHRFPDDKTLFQFVDDVLQQSDIEVKKQKIRAFLESPDSNPRPFPNRVGRFATEQDDTISA